MRLRSRFSPRASLMFCIVTLGSIPRFAAADDPHARAAESFREGQAAFERHEFSSAAAAFEVAAGFEPQAVSLLDAADAWTRAREPVRAADDCDHALAMPTISDAERAYAKQLLAKNEKAVATIHISAKSTVTLKIDGGDELHAPLQKRLAPGTHAIEWNDLVSGNRAHRDLVLVGGELQEVTSPFPDATPAPAKLPSISKHQETDRTFHVPTASWICGGVSVAAVGVASVFGVLTLDAQNDFNANPTSTARDTFYRDRTITDVGWTVAAIGLVAGVVITVVANVGQAPAQSASRAEPLRIRF
jgi:hypothetical protein